MATGIVKRLRGLHHDMHRNISCLPDEVISEILLYLAAEDLQNFKSVSSFWCKFISRPYFVNAHLIRCQQQSELENILYATVTQPRKSTTKYKYHHFSINNRQTNLTPRKLQSPCPTDEENVLSLQASCDGLLLYQDKYYHERLYVSNPVTGMFEALPLAARCYNWALVRDNSIGRYKVFGVRYQFHYCVFTLGENTLPSGWDLQTIPHEKGRSFRLFSQLVLVKNELHWLTTDEDGDSLNIQECYCIYSINVENLSFRKTKVPQRVLKTARRDLFDFMKYTTRHLLSEVSGSLCLTFVSHYQLQMFVLEDITRCAWTKSHTIPLHSLRNLPAFGSFLSGDICFVSKTGIEDSNLLDPVKVLLHYEDVVWFYDLKSQELRRIGNLSKGRKLSKLCFFHSNSLVSWR